jgi:hypothetical protein
MVGGCLGSLSGLGLVLGLGLRSRVRATVIVMVMVRIFIRFRFRVRFGSGSGLESVYTSCPSLVYNGERKAHKHGWKSSEGSRPLIPLNS